jgi:hypothetical protein
MRYGCAVLCLALGSVPAGAQSVISAHSGMIHYIEGDVAIDGTSIHPKFAQFPEVKSSQVLATEEGRAEVLLTPGVFLRLAENSSVRMLSNSLADTRIAVIFGSVLIEAGELLPNNAVSFEVQGAHIAIPKKGLYRIDADAARLEVFDGQALVTLDRDTVTARKGHRVTLAGETLSDEKFDVKTTDPFYRWSGRRAEYIAAANVTAAHVAANSDYRSSYTSGGGGGVGGSGAWSWNPWFGMYTFLPASGVYWSPFGSAFYSPGVVNTLYLSQRPIYGRPAFGNSGGMLGGMVGVPASAGTSAPPSLGAAPGVSGTRGGGFRGAPAGGSMGPGRSMGTRGR